MRTIIVKTPQKTKFKMVGKVSKCYKAAEKMITKHAEKHNKGIETNYQIIIK